jgi:hypothetical protein
MIFLAGLGLLVNGMVWASALSNAWGDWAGIVGFFVGLILPVAVIHAFERKELNP